MADDPVRYVKSEVFDSSKKSFFEKMEACFRPLFE